MGGGTLNYYLLTLTGDIITGNSANVSGGGIEDEGTALSVTNSNISQNTSANGGGIFSNATTTITSCQLTGNTSTHTGGGISDSAESTVNVDRTTLSGNSATGNGGGISNLGTLTVTNSTLSANTSAADGGGLAHLGGTSDIVNSTLSGNSDGGGGGLGGGIAALHAGVSVLDSTLSGNSASSSGGGIYLGSPVLLANTIIANSSHGGDLAGGTVAEGSVNNLIDDAATGSGLTNGVGGNILNHPASLGALGSNGGPTQTFNLLPGSLALSAGTDQALTTLGEAAASTGTSLTIAPGATVGVGLYVRIDSEIVLITGIPSTTTLTVLRGQLGTTAAAHLSGASLTLATDQRGDVRSALTPDIGAFEGVPTVPIVTSISLGTLPIVQGTAGQAYTSSIAISNSVGAISDFTFTGLPTGLTATLSGASIVLSGTSTQSGVFTLHASVTDSTAAVATGTYTLTITSVPVITNPVIAGTLVPALVINPATVFGQSSGVDTKLKFVVQSASANGAAVLTKTIRVSHGSAKLSNLTIHKAGVYNVVVSDSLGHSTTEQVTIVAAAPSQLWFVTQPTFVNGQSAVTVHVLDRYGNLSAVRDGTTATLQLGPHPFLGSQPTLGGTVTATVVNGTASFPAVTVNENGQARLIATDGKLRSRRSNVFSNA